MTDDQEEKQPKPLLYKVEPDCVEQVVSQQAHVEKQEGTEGESANKEEKMEQIKREFGIYEVMEEIEQEKEHAKQWTQAYQEQKQEEQPIVHEQRERRKEKIVMKKKKKQKSVAELITELAYSTKEPKPFCEAYLFGAVTQFQVVGIHGEAVKIKIGNRVRIIKLSDIEQFRLILK